MPLRREITQVFEAIPERIEVSGTGPTWRVTGGSFDAVISWANDAFDSPVVIAREDRNRWWPRVTLTVTTDPALAAEAPPLASFSEPQPAAFDELHGQDVADGDASDASDAWNASAAEPQRPADDHAYSPLEEIFASQEARRPRHLPDQRRPGRGR
jgi:hypothetical protein